MSHSPRYEGKLHMPHGLTHALVFTGSGEAGSIVALFTNKTLCDKAANEFNATIGRGKPLYQVARIFGD